MGGGRSLGDRVVVKPDNAYDHPGRFGGPMAGHYGHVTGRQRHQAAVDGRGGG
jgi:hypothetical protein